MADHECILLFRERPKSRALGSYRYSELGRPGYPPRVIHKVSFLSSKGLSFPLGFTLRLGRGDPSALRELREKALKEGQWKDGSRVERGQVYQVRRNWGGRGGSGTSWRSMVRKGQVDTSNSGTQIIIREFRV